MEGSAGLLADTQLLALPAQLCLTATSSENMAPCNMRTLDDHSATGLRKLRKPAIEKMRRDRINSSIEQLRLLLEKDFQKHQLPSKPEKADILEMTVTLMQQHMAEKYVTSATSQAHKDGYSTCVRDSVSFLQTQTEAQLHLLQNLHGAQRVTGPISPSAFPVSLTTSKHSTPDSSKVLWRPW